MHCTPSDFHGEDDGKDMRSCQRSQEARCQTMPLCPHCALPPATLGRHALSTSLPSPEAAQNSPFPPSGCSILGLRPALLSTDQVNPTLSLDARPLVHQTPSSTRLCLHTGSPLLTRGNRNGWKSKNGLKICVRQRTRRSFFTVPAAQGSQRELRSRIRLAHDVGNLRLHVTLAASDDDRTGNANLSTISVSHPQGQTSRRIE
jgi:hypothetical protein